MMKRNPLGLLLVLLLLVCVGATTLLAYYTIISSRKLQYLQVQVADINGPKRAALSLLVNELKEYSKKNPAIDPILESTGIKPRSNQPNLPGRAVPPARP